MKYSFMKGVIVMKKSNLIVGCAYILVGIICLILGVMTETKLDGLLWGLTGAGIIPGGMMVYQYFYWTSPKNIERYNQRMEVERIERNDELKEKVRGKSAQYAYGIGIMVISFSMLLFTILDLLGIIQDGKIFVLYLGAYLGFQVVIGIVLFRRLMKKY